MERTQTAGRPLKPEQAIRRVVLGEICRAWFDGNKSALAGELGVTAGYVNNMISGRKPIADQAARSICSHLEIPPGSLDTPLGGPLGPRHTRPFHRRGLSMLSETTRALALKMDVIVDETQRRMIESVINTAYQEHLRSQPGDHATEKIEKGKIQ